MSYHKSKCILTTLRIETNSKKFPWHFKNKAKSYPTILSESCWMSIKCIFYGGNQKSFYEVIWILVVMFVTVWLTRFFLAQNDFFFKCFSWSRHSNRVMNYEVITMVKSLGVKVKFPHCKNFWLPCACWIFYGSVISL